MLWVCDGLNGEGWLLFDFNLWVKDGVIVLVEWVFFDDGCYFVYGIQDGGMDWCILKVIDVMMGKELFDCIEWVKYLGIVWKFDGSGFFYLCFDVLVEGVKFQLLMINQQVWLYKVGMVQDVDVMVYVMFVWLKLGYSVQVIDDGKWLVIILLQGIDLKVEINIVVLDGGLIKMCILIVGFDNSWELVGMVGLNFWFVIDKDVLKGWLIVVDVVVKKLKFKQVVV